MDRESARGRDNLPAVGERGAAPGTLVRDVYLTFHVRLFTEEEEHDFALRFRFLCPRAGVRSEGDGRVWIGFRAYASDVQDARTQAALAVRWAAIKAKIRHVPQAEGETLHDVGAVHPHELDNAHRARAAFYAHLHDEPPHLVNPWQEGLAGAAEGGGAGDALGLPAPGASEPASAPEPPLPPREGLLGRWRRWLRRRLR